MKLLYRASSRRGLLRGAAATLALPFLPSLLPRQARAGGTAAPTRLVFWYTPNGFHMPEWTPSTTGANYDLPYILEPLAPVQDRVCVLSGLRNEAAFYPLPGDHARGTGTFMTCAPLNEPQEPIYNGISADQVAAQARGDQTLFPSLELGLEGGGTTGDCDSGYSCAYVRNVAWAGPQTPLPKVSSARLLFDRLFAGADDTISAEEAERRQALRLSVLDHALDDANRLHARLGATDRLKLDEYMTGVRELETRIEASADQVCAVPGRPDGGLDLQQEAAAMIDLMVLALECDQTRVISFMLGNGGSNRSYSFLGVSGAHHELSHHQGNASNHAALMEIGRWEIEVFSGFLQALAARDAGDGTSLLDSSLVYLSSEIEDGDRHWHANLPTLLAGTAGGVQSGRHLSYDDAPMADLFLFMLDAFGAPQSSFGMDGTAPLAGLT